MKRISLYLGFLLSFFTPLLTFAHSISEADKAAMLNGGYLKYIWLGTTHMLTGYDHLLFIFGVIFFLTTFKDIVKFISVFTFAHCITLIFATFFKITANYYLIDAVIAVSVMYKGFENIDGFKKCFKWEPPTLLKMVFIFGLIHGFGLSTRLQQLPLGDDKMSMLLRILSFNVGVEVGQIVALSVMLIFLSGWKKAESFAKFAYATNVGLIAGGIFLFFMQFHGYWHTSDPDAFPMNQDDHSHVHKDMEQEQVEAAVPVALELLTKKDKLGTSWTSAKVEKKKRLYLFITTKGFLNGANFTRE